jgi:hypothetical protein
MSCPGAHASPRFVTYDWIDGVRYARYTCGACGDDWLERA